MPIESLRKLYDGVSQTYNIGDFDTFSNKMQSPESRRKFYDQVSENLNIGDYDSFELKVSSKAPSIDPDEVFVDPNEKTVKTSNGIDVPENWVKSGGTWSDRLIKALEDGRKNPQHVISAAKEPEDEKEAGISTPQFVMGIPTSEIPGLPDKFKKKDTESFEPTSADVAEFLNKRFLQREIAKEKQKGLSERDAYRKVVRDVGGTPPSVVDLAMEKSITGAVFRIGGLDQTVNLDDYPSNSYEDIASGVLSMLMPVDALLFKAGGSLAGIKAVGRYADKAANLIAKNTNMPLRVARVHAKNALSRITGGAGGFAAFDSGRNIVDQIEFTGKIDPLEVAEQAMLGGIKGGSVGFLGGVGSFAGKKLHGITGASVSSQARTK